MNLGELAGRAAGLWGPRVAVHDAQGALSFAGLHGEVERVAARLRALGVGAGAGVGLVAGNGRGFLIGLFALLRCGAVVLPLAPRMRARELDEVLRLAGIHFLLDHSGTAPAGTVVWHAVDEADGPFRLCRSGAAPAAPIAPHVADPALIRFTSGTTGQAKGVVISHRSALERIAAANGALGLGPDDTVAWVLPMAYHFVVSILLYVHCGAAIAVCDEFDAGAIIDTINRHRATTLYATPAHIRLLAADAGGAALPSLRQSISTTAGISADACERFLARFGLPVCQALGIIEVGLPVFNRRRAADRPDAIGEAVPGYQVEILDQALRPLPAGSIGRLALRGPGMFDGYLSPPLTRAQVLQDGWFLSGDLACKDADGLIRIEGREKSAINVAGTKVFPEEVEQVLGEHPAVARCRAFGRTLPLVGECVAAQVQAHEGAAPRPAELMAWCRARLSAHKVPRAIELVEEIALTSTGKVARS